MTRCVGQGGKTQPWHWKILNSSAAKLHKPRPLPLQNQLLSGVGYCWRQLLGQLHIPSAHCRGCFVTSQRGIQSQQRRASPAACEGFSSRASYSPAGAGLADTAPCSADPHQLGGHGRALNVAPKQIVSGAATGTGWMADTQLSPRGHSSKGTSWEGGCGARLNKPMAVSPGHVALQQRSCSILSALLAL